MEQIKEPNTDEVDEENPQLMNVATVIRMFQEIKQQVKDAELSPVEVPIEAIKEECTQKVVDSISVTMSKELEEMNQLKKEAAAWKYRSEAISEVCDRMSTYISDLEQRIENLELNNSRKMAIITGLECESVEKTRMVEFIQEFFTISMEITVNVDDVFKLKSKGIPPIVVVFQSIQDKKLALKNKSLLKHFEGETKIFLNDYLPPVTQEKRRRERDVTSIAKSVYGDEKNILYKSRPNYKWSTL